MSKEREIKELSGGTTQKNLLLKDLRSFKVAVPNKVIQTSIAKILSDLDSKIELLQKQNKTLEAIGQAIFKHWFVDFEFPNEEGKPYKSSGGEMVFNEELQREIPKGWEALKYSEIVNYTFGFPFNSKFFNEKDGFPIIRIRDLPNNDTAFFTMENYDAKYIVDAGNLVVGMDGEFRAYIWKGLEVLLNQRIVKILSKYEYVPRSYLYYVLFEPLRFIENSKVGTTVIHLNKQDLDSITVLLPDEKTLILFGEIVDKLLDKQVENHLQSIKLSLIRDGLLPKLMSGEIRVNNLEAGTE